MANLTSLPRVKIQLLALERTLRNIRLALEHDMMSLDNPTVPQPKTVQVNSPMSTFLSTHNSFSPVRISPFEHFFPGICCGYNPTGDGPPLTISGVSYSHPIPNELDVTTTCLLLNVDLGVTTSADYLTIETDLDLSDLRRTKDLTLCFSCLFRASNEVILSPFRVAMRLKVGPEFKTYYTKSYPSMHYPFDFVYKLDAVQYKDLPLADATVAKILIHLPVDKHLAYSLSWSHFDVSGNSR